MRISQSKRLFLILLFFTAASFLVSPKLRADTLYLKNGHQIEGVVEHEDDDSVELNLGYGTTTFHRSEISRLVKSDAKETEAIWGRWGEERKEIEKRKPEEERKWQARQAELDRLHREELKAKADKDVYGPKDIQVLTKNGAMLVNVLLNGKIRATLVLDSGAAICFLSKNVAEKLNIDLDKLKRVDFRVADGRAAPAAVTTLESLQVQDSGVTSLNEKYKTALLVKDVPVSFALEEDSGKPDHADGLLGMSFLQNFKFQADYTNSKVTFERLKEKAADPVSR